MNAIRQCPVCEKDFNYRKSRHEWCDDCDDKLRKPPPVGVKPKRPALGPRPTGDNEFARARLRWERRYAKR